VLCICKNSFGFFVFSIVQRIFTTTNNKLIIIMETKKERKTSRKMKKYTPEERRAINATIVPQNKSMKAFAEHQGEVWVKDPMLLL